MSEEHYIKCPYCSKTIKYGDPHLDSCTPNYIDGQLLWCYSCGEKNGEYSTSQLKKEDNARCFDCVKNGKIKKFEPYDYLSRYIPHKINLASIDKQLENAVSYSDIEKVNELLLLNANVNYVIQETVYCPIRHTHLFSYNIDGTEKPELDENQPTTPLKICVFKFSDCCLTDIERLKIIEIAKQLIKFGASVYEAKEYYESRYGKNPKNDLWNTFYELLCN